MESPAYYFLKPIIIIVIMLSATGCMQKERVYENMYEGLRMREQIVNPKDEPVPPPPPDYSGYKWDREKILQDIKEELK